MNSTRKHVMSRLSGTDNAFAVVAEDSLRFDMEI